MRSLTKLFVAAILLTGSVHPALPSPPAAQKVSGNSSAVLHGASLATVQAACPGAQEHSLPLPTSVPPGEFVDYEKRVLKFLQNGEYTKWCVDKSMRDTGPYLHAVYSGTHPAVRIYYSPKKSWSGWWSARREGLKVPQKQKPRGRLWLNDGSCVRLRPTHRNHVWSYDFVSAR